MTQVFRFDPNQIFDAIENGDVLYDLLDATGAWGLQIRMEHNEILQDAKKRLSTQPEFAQYCYDRARELVGFVEEEGYAHPKRTAIAAYLFLLFYSDLQAGRELINELAAANRPDLAEVSDLIREYSQRRPNLEVREAQPVCVCSVSIQNPGSESKKPKTVKAPESSGNTFVTTRAYAIAA